jgi:hypothetical protein
MAFCSKIPNLFSVLFRTRRFRNLGRAVIPRILAVIGQQTIRLGTGAFYQPCDLVQLSPCELKSLRATNCAVTIKESARVFVQLKHPLDRMGLISLRQSTKSEPH